MKVIDVYEQYFAAECTYSGVPRHAAVIKLTATSDAGTITYEVGVSFFPHNDPEDLAAGSTENSRPDCRTAEWNNLLGQASDRSPPRVSRIIPAFPYC